LNFENYCTQIYDKIFEKALLNEYADAKYFFLLNDFFNMKE